FLRNRIIFIIIFFIGRPQRLLKHQQKKKRPLRRHNTNTGITCIPTLKIVPSTYQDTFRTSSPIRVRMKNLPRLAHTVAKSVAPPISHESVDEIQLYALEICEGLSRAMNPGASSSGPRCRGSAP
ncbi:hypothetical protein GcM3_181045, partial [Golovinomyces cichoracearum]